VERRQVDNWTRRFVKKGSVSTKSASGRARTRVAKAASISSLVHLLRRASPKHRIGGSSITLSVPAPSECLHSGGHFASYPCVGVRKELAAGIKGRPWRRATRRIRRPADSAMNSPLCHIRAERPPPISCRLPEGFLHCKHRRHQSRRQPGKKSNLCRSIDEKRCLPSVE
jgi:hypothetical protein